MGQTYAVARSFIGVAKETTKGTAVAPTAYIPVTKFDADPKQDKIKDTGWRGSMGDLYGIQNGIRSAETSVSGDVFTDTFGFFLAGILGDVVVTGASSPFSHAMSLKNAGDGQPGAFTFTDQQAGIGARAYPGAQVSSVNLKWDAAGKLQYDASLLSYIDASASTPTPTFSNNIPIPAWAATMSFGGTAQANVESAEVNLKRDGAAPLFGVGSQDPYAIPVGALQVDGKFVVVAKDLAPYTAYTSNTSPGVVAVNFSQGASSALALQLSSLFYTDAKVTRGKAYAELELTWQAVLNASDAGGTGGLSPIKATLTNSLPSGTFA